MEESILRIQNVYSWLETNDTKFNKLLWSVLRFRDKGYFHSPAYKKGLWDGYTDFYNINSGMFLTGLLPEVLAALKYYKKPYRTIDERETIKWQYDTIDSNFLNRWLPDGFDPVTLHDYQVDLVHQAIRYNRGLVKAPTGAGKTFILISLLKCLPPGTPTLFLTKNASLVDQNYQDMKTWGVPNLGRFYGKYKEPNRTLCCTVGSLKNIKKLLPEFKACFVDEVHDCMSDIPIKAFKAMKKCTIRVGISATPFKFTKKRKDGTEDCKDKIHKYNTKGHFGSIFKINSTESGYLTTKDLQERSILSKSRCTFYYVDVPKNIQYEPYMDAVTLGISNNFEFLKIVKRLATSLRGRSLILVERIDQGEYLNQLIPGSLWLQGKDDLEKRAAAFKQLKYDGGNTVAIAMRHIVTAGINVFVHNLINASGGQAEHSIVQQMGRGLRVAGDKDVLDFYDFIFRTNEYLFKHSNNRLDVLAHEGHDIIVKEDYDF